MKIISKLIIAVLLISVAYISYGVYSMSWSKRFLDPIKNGMSMSEVRSTIGSAVDEYDRGGGRMTWDYNRWLWTDAVVHFDKHGFVQGKEYD
jgi:hypothetical protein